MKDINNSYPPDVEPLDTDHEFFSDLASLIEEYAETEEEVLRFLYALEDFKTAWIGTYYITGSLWLREDED